MRLFSIPTNRNCELAFKSLLNELASIDDPTSFAILILDSSVDEIRNENYEIIKRYSAGTDIPCYFITIEEMTGAVNRILEKAGIDNDYSKLILFNSRVDYGRIANLLYILACMFRAAFLHRRDSDCYFDSEHKGWYPVLKETQYIGQKLSAFPDSELCGLDKVSADYKENRILIAGSSYIGNWNLDFQELMAKDSESLTKLFRICGNPEEKIQQKIDHMYNSDGRYDFPDMDILKNSINVCEEPECGNMSICELYKYVPNLIGANGIGFDYFTYMMGLLFNTPMIYHRNKIYHIHNKKRYDEKGFLRYWTGICKMILLDIVYTDFIRSNTPARIAEGMSGLEAIESLCDNRLPDEIERIVDSVDREYGKELIFKFCNGILINSDIDKYCKAGKQLIDSVDSIIDEMNEDLRESIALIRVWKRITSAAEAIDWDLEGWRV